MAIRYEVKRIHKTDRSNPYKHIDYIEVEAAYGSRRKITQQQAIEEIESGKSIFYVNRGGRMVDVIVAISPWGHKCIKTVADGERPDNLLSLPECP